MPKVMVTGAGGFVGRHVMARLAALPDPVAAVGIGLDAPGFDVADAAAVDAAIARHRPDAVIHLAGIAHPRTAGDRPRRAWAVNFQGAQNLAWALRDHAPAARLVFAGSSQAYGASFETAAGAPVGEDMALRPQTVYAATKACADIALGQEAARGLDCIRFRPFNHSGPGQSPDYVIADFARQVAEIAAGLRPPRLQVGNIEAARDFLDVRDVARAYVAAALADIAPGADNVFNLASGRAVRLGRIIEMLADLAGREIAVEVDAARLRAGDLPCAVGDPARAREVLGWTAEIALERTVADVFAEQQRAVSERQG